ncbi:LOW QUALITY PROTEIN: uncharacterized protein EMH_0020770 [Eimeria mitis]|uniref:Uncharacterized protein n=1 Tax=Eimeria mitis TaxID=44415 RepID=U6KGD5_9EIME|nr:LOW QUALITY PROTEIN: uncharacterized protein EMH_0020770 [Eimeria mitis]CDJ34528.1 hypothetical protein EMH_0020770 [Eimeria mitis]
MEGYGNNERFPRGLNPLPSSTPTQVKGDSELPPPSHAQANPGASGQLTGEPSGADFSRAAVRRRATESRCKEASGASTAAGGAIHASSVNIGEQRRLERQQRQVVQFRLHSDKITKVSRSPSNAVRGPSPPDGPAGSVIPSEAHKYSAPDASADPDLSHLQKRRTWVLLQHLVDQLEKDGRPDDLLQRPELLQKLLRVVMPLVPLRDALGKFAADSRTTNTAGLQGPVDERDYSPNRMAQRPSARPVSTACFRSMHANAPTRSAENRLRPALHHNSRASPTRTLSASASRGVVQAPRGWSEDNPVASRPGVQYPGFPIDASRNAFNGSSKDRDSRRAPSTRVRAVPKRDVGNSAEPGGLVAPLRWYDKPRPVRSVSTGNSYMHVASRLPQGALQHKRPLKTRSPAALLEKNTEERKAFRPTAVNWATSPRHISEPVTEPVASARSEDSQDTLNSAVTPLLEDIVEDCPELGLPRQLGAGSLCAVDWNANMPQPLVRFTSTRVVEALPPSPRASNSDGETPQSGGSGRSVSASQGSPVTHEDPQSVDREAQLPALTKAPSPLPGSRRRLAAEPKAPTARRHTVATVVASAQHSTEEDRPMPGGIQLPPLLPLHNIVRRRIGLFDIRGEA